VPTNQHTDRGLLAGLFDINFTTFVTLRFLKAIYVVLLVLILLGGVLFFVSSIARGGASGVVLAVVVAPLGTFLYLMLARIYLEVLALLFRIGENTSAIAAALTSTGGGYAGSYGAVPPPGQPHPPAGT